MSSKRPTAKTAQVHTKRGVASNRQGIRYGARTAGKGSEHFEPGGRLHIAHTHGSSKQVQGENRAPRKKAKGKEQRIVSG